MFKTTLNIFYPSEAVRKRGFRHGLDVLRASRTIPINESSTPLSLISEHEWKTTHDPSQN